MEQPSTSAPARPLPLTSLNHISRVCKSVTKTKEFYRDVLGFIEIKRPSSLDFEGSWLYNYGIGIHLIEGKPEPRPERINTKADHLSFQSDSLCEVERRLREYGIPFERGEVMEGGVRVCQLFFHDPDNSMIEICNCDCLPVLPLSASSASHCVGLATNMPQACKRPTPHLDLERTHSAIEPMQASRSPSYASSQDRVQPLSPMSADSVAMALP